jgi:hypothetical protein
MRQSHFASGFLGQAPGFLGRPAFRLVAPDHCTAGKVSHSDIDQT